MIDLHRPTPTNAPGDEVDKAVRATAQTPQEGQAQEARQWQHPIWHGSGAAG